MEDVAERLRGLGFRVRIEDAEYFSLTGGRVKEERLIAVSGDGLVRVTLSTGGGSYRLTLLAHGPRASRGLADSLEDLGASVDYGEERLVAVFRLGSLDEVKRILGSIY